LYNKAKTTLIQYPEGKTGTNFSIPNSVTSIGNSAFKGCTNLTWLGINKVTSIEVEAFKSCTSLTSIFIPNSVTYIGDYAFDKCTSLTSVTFASGSNIPNANFGNNVFPEGSSGDGGDVLKTSYCYPGGRGKEGTYTRTANGSTWTKTSN